MSGRSSTDDQVGDWSYLCRELRRRTREAIKSIPFVVHLILGIGLFGGLGIWIEIVKITNTEGPTGYSALSTAIITFFSALSGMNAFYLILISTNQRDKVFISFSWLVFIILTLAAVFLGYFSINHPTKVLYFAALCSIFAVWIWWITNADDPAYKKIPAPDVAVGGKVDRPLAGDLKDFEV